MQAIEELNSKNFTLYAFKNYDNPQCVDIDEFYEDLQRFKYLKKIINRYLESGNVSERLLLNHIIVLSNIFGIEAALKMLEYKMDDRHWPVLKPCLILLNYIEHTDYPEIALDPVIVQILRKI